MDDQKRIEELSHRLGAMNILLSAVFGVLSPEQRHAVQASIEETLYSDALARIPAAKGYLVDAYAMMQMRPGRPDEPGAAECGLPPRL